MPQTTTRRSERRDTMRADAQLSMRLGAFDSEAPEIVTETQNISASGLYCLSPHYLAPLSKVDLTLVLPDRGRSAAGRLLQCEAVVVRCQAATDRRRRYELACSFLGLPDAQRRVLAEFVALRNLKSLSGATAVRQTSKMKSSAKQRPARPRAAAKGVTRKTAAKPHAAKPVRKAAPVAKRKTARKSASRRRP